MGQQEGQARRLVGPKVAAIPLEDLGQRHGARGGVDLNLGRAKRLGGGVEPFVQGVGGVQLDRRAALGAAHERKVDARVDGRRHDLWFCLFLGFGLLVFLRGERD